MNRKRITRQNGSTFVMVAVSIMLLLIILGLVVDVGYRFVLKNRLQNAADAAALRGAGLIYRDGVLGNAFVTGSAVALSANSSATNYFTIDEPKLELASLSVSVNNWNNLTPPGNTTAPAVKVSVAITPTQFFSFLGANQNINVTSLAVVPYPASITAHLLPMAIADCAIKDFWDSVTQKPKIISSSNLVNGKTYVINSLGNTNWTLLGAPANSSLNCLDTNTTSKCAPMVGTVFTASGSCTGGSCTGNTTGSFQASTSPLASGSCSAGPPANWTPLCSVNSGTPPYFGKTSPDVNGTQYNCSGSAGTGGSPAQGIAPIIPVPSTSYRGMLETMSMGQVITITNGTTTKLYQDIATCSTYCMGGNSSTCSYTQRQNSCQYVSLPVIQTPGGDGTTNNPGTGAQAGESTVIGFACAQILKVNASGTPKTISIGLSTQNCELPKGGGGGRFYGVYLPPKLGL